MNCPKCNAKLKEGARFCTSCGTKVQEQTKEAQEPANVCPNCSSPLKPNARFCTKCGTKLTESAPNQNQAPITTQKPSSSNIVALKNKIFWSIQPGEVARLINETEFESYKTVLGIIINEGTKALIRVNGEIIAELSSGAYDIIDNARLQDMLYKQAHPVETAISNHLGFFARLLSGNKKEENNTQKTVETSEKSLIEAINKLKGGSVFSIILMIDTQMPLLFGAEQASADDYATFKPATIQTKYTDIALGMNTFFSISEAKTFAKYYMSNVTSLSTTDLLVKLTPYVTTATRKVLRQIEIKENYIPQDVQMQLFLAIKSMARDIFFGLDIEKLVEVSMQSEDLERFRMLSNELYLSEQELDYLKRTNDFKNRLATAVNDQVINEKLSEVELKKRLQEINKDELLTADELEKFKTVLENEKIIRNAKSEDEIEAAKAEIERTKLIREEDLDALAHQLRTNSYQREAALEYMRLKDAIEFNKTQQKGVDEVEMEHLRAQLEMGRMQDDYQDERFHKELKQSVDARRADISLKKEEKENDYDLEERERKDQFERFRQMAEMKERSMDSQHQRELEAEKQKILHEEELVRLKSEELKLKYQSAKDLSPEQLMAIATTEGLSAEAAAKFAESFSAGKDIEQERKHQEEMNKLNQSRVEDMKEMMREMMLTSREMTGHLVQNKDEMKNEYKEQMIHEQRRTDNTQDKALNYATRQNQQQQPVPQQPIHPTGKAMPNGRICPACGKINDAECGFCQECGYSL